MERYPAPSQCAASLPRLLSPLRNRRVRRSGEHRPHDRRTPPQVGPGRGFQRAVRLGWVRPGLRTERRSQDDTPKGKMVRALLPSILKVLIQFGCCATATLAQVGMTPAGGRAACLTSIEKFLAPPVPPSGRRRLSSCVSSAETFANGLEGWPYRTRSPPAGQADLSLLGRNAWRTACVKYLMPAAQSHPFRPPGLRTLRSRSRANAALYP